MSAALKPGLISVAEFERLAVQGEFQHMNDRVELIRGVIVPMSPVGWAHAKIVSYLMKLLLGALEDRAFITCQSGLHLSDTEFQPDLLVSRNDQLDGTDTPGADTSFLVIEVSDTTYRTDVKVKLPIYAEAGIPEYWIVNIPKRWVEVYRQPDETRGIYLHKSVIDLKGAVSPKQFPEVTLQVSEIFRPIRGLP